MREVVENGYKLMLLVGLPGSGKTKFAEDLIAKGERENKAYDYIDPNFVELKKRLKDIKELGLEKVLRRNLRGSIRTDEILDGCLIGNEDLKLAINTVLDSKDFEKVEIHYWKPNKEALAHNNKYQEVDKVETFEIEPVNLEWLKSETEFSNIELINHEIELKAAYVLFAEKYDLRLISDGAERGKGKRYLTSDTWYLGGTSRDHNGDHYHTSGESPLSNFDVFDDLLMEVCPTISFLQYKKLYSSTVTIETRTESDYYSDSEYAYYSCDIEELVKQLVNMGIYTV
jgi:hypothetical protein